MQAHICTNESVLIKDYRQPMYSMDGTQINILNIVLHLQGLLFSWTTKTDRKLTMLGRYNKTLNWC